jgi:hypothetical protein
VFLIVTVAPDIAAPDESLIVPRIVPRKVCASALIPKILNAKSDATAKTRALILLPTNPFIGLPL